MISGFINRTLGFGLRLILVRVIGDQGIGLFQMVFPIFITFSILATFGFSVAISKFVSERISKNNYCEILKILKIAVIFAVITGSFFTVILYFNAPFVANNILNNAKTELLLKAIAPALFFVTIASMFRGFFQGLRMMAPTATSQIIEQITRIIVTLIVIKTLLDYQLKYQVTGAALGISAGEGLGLLTLLFIFFKVKTDIIQQIQPTANTETSWSLFKELIKFGFPITIGKVVASLIYSLEAILIPARLQAAGYSVSQATSLYGQLSGMVLQIVHLPTIITVAVTSSLIPAVSEAISANNHQRFQDHYQQALRLTIYTGLPAAVIFFLLPEKICSILFGYPQAGSILQLFALGAIFLYLLQILKGILQGLGSPNTVVINSIVGLVFEVVLIYFLVSQPNIGLNGAIIAITIRFIVITILHFISIYRKVNLTLDLKQLILKPLLAASFLAISLTPIYQYFWRLNQNNLLSTILAISIGMIGYLLILIITRGITSKDINRILN
ncbi:stage V sporulation protein B [Sporohalobacter salinus]|nr:stage V sporulation protein B [Sporohalobacter salinus]